MKIWECFCKHSLSNPKIYYNIFFGKYSNSLNNDIKEYYSIFPEELGKQQEDTMVILLGQNMYEGNLDILKSCANEGFIKKENIVDINEMVVLIYQGMISRILNNGTDYDVEDLKDKIMKYIEQVIISFEGNIFAD
jgi:Icc-related predicted phosphoesterase